MQAVRKKALGTELLGQLLREEQIGRFALAVCDLRTIRFARTRSCSEKLGHDQLGKEEIAKMVGGKLRFEAILGLGARPTHDSGIIDQHVDIIRIGIHLLGYLTYLLQRCKVKLESACGEAGFNVGEVFGSGLGLGMRTSGEYQQLRLGFGNGLDEKGAQAAG